MNKKRGKRETERRATKRRKMKTLGGVCKGCIQPFRNKLLKWNSLKDSRKAKIERENGEDDTDKRK